MLLIEITGSAVLKNSLYNFPSGGHKAVTVAGTHCSQSALVLIKNRDVKQLTIIAFFYRFLFPKIDYRYGNCTRR